MTGPRRITLIGPFGAGKSTVSRLVAERLGWKALDLDDVVQREAGKDVQRLFDEEGEAAFRRREAAALQGLRSKKDLVVAAGGGATVYEPSRRLIAESGLVVCLLASAETIAARSDREGGAPRPMLDSRDRLGRITRLLDQRAALYSQADFVLQTDALTPNEASDAVAAFALQRGDAAFERPGRVQQLARTPSITPPILDAPGATAIVRTASGEYPSYVGWGILEHLGDYVRRATGVRRAFLLSDSSVLDSWGATAEAALRGSGIEFATAAVSPGDSTKSLASAGKLYGWLAEQRAERGDAVVALGGGMVGDLAGFVAATYLRGMPLVQAPTSLLGMVDASIGGKTAVNHAGAKNIVGAFYQPRAVVADVATLKTLPRRELVEGLGEVIKHALIQDEILLATMEKRIDDLLALEPELTTEIIAINIAIKAAIVSEDERETGGRRELLNYGHTLGHAFEAAGDYMTLLHGEAVAVGMMAASMIGVRLGITPAAVLERQRAILARAGLPSRPPAGLDRDRLRRALAMDKKIIGGTQRWVLLEDVGKPVVRDDVPGKVVSDVVDELMA